MESLLENPHLLIDHIRIKLFKQAGNKFFLDHGGKKETDAAVLFLMGMHCRVPDEPPEPCLIFTQRSRNVPQPGDLCFPGGGVSPYLDHLLAGFLKLPGFPLFRSPSLNGSHSRVTTAPRGMKRLLATCLRESFEEMRLNPFRTVFLGPMAPEPFPLFNRTIYPMVAWTLGQKRFVLNREVERLVYIPLRHFLDRTAYHRFRAPAPVSDQPCITYRNGYTRDLLWGITYRIVMHFLDIVFNFRPPEMSRLPIVPKQMGENRP